MSEILIEARALTRHFGGRAGLFGRAPVVHAVDGVDLAVQRGDTFAIVGESGCGKSTLARLLLRLIEPTSGDVIFEGRPLASLAAADLRRLRCAMQIVFQDPFASLNPRLSVAAIVGEPLWLHGLVPARQRADRVAELLRMVGLDPAHASRFPHEFSGGQRQRIGIARALAAGPKLLVGDEPVSALDVSIQAQIINLLEDLKAELGLTLIIVSHDLAVVRHMSDRVAVMYLGEIVEEAPVEALFERALHPYTQALLGADPVRSPEARRERPVLEGDLPSPAAPPPGCRFHTRCPHARSICREQHPVAETVDGDRHVACHRWRDIAGATTDGGDAGPSPQLERRLALYRAHAAV